MTMKVQLAPALLGLGLALTGCSSAQPDQAGASSSAAASAEPAASSPGGGQAGPRNGTDGTDPLASFLASDAGARYTGTVTGVQELGGTNGGIRVHRLDTDLTDRERAVELCQAYQSAMTTGQEQVNVLDAEQMFLATTNGDPGTCTTAGTEPETTPPPPGPTQTPDDGPVVPAPDPNAPFTYEEAYAAWHNGMPYYEAFCVNYTPVTDGGVAQCEGINAGTVGYTTGEYLGP
jgi:hypothetical protein